MSNITFDLKCVRANPQAGICEVGGSGGGGASTSSNGATVRGSSIPPPLNIFQTGIVQFVLTPVEFGATVVTNPDLVWTGSPDYQYTISIPGNYFLSFGLCADNTLLPGTNNQIFEWGGFFRVFDSLGVFKADYGKVVTYGGISPSINAITSTNNYSGDLTITSSIIAPLVAGDRVKVITIFASNTSGPTMSLIDPTTESIPGSGLVGSSWFSIKKV